MVLSARNIKISDQSTVSDSDWTVVDLDEEYDDLIPIRNDLSKNERTPIAKVISGYHHYTSYLSSVCPSPKAILTGIASVISTIPVSIYSFAFPMKINPEYLTLALWTSQSTSMKMLIIAFTMISLGAGALMRYKHIPTMSKKIQELFSSYCQNMPTFFKNNFILLMSSLAALSSLALGYYGFLWGGQTIAIGVAAVNFLITFGFRVESMSVLIDKIRNIFDKDQQFQNDLIHELKRIKPEHIERFEKNLKSEMNAGNAFDEVTVRKCLLNLYDKTCYIDLDMTNPGQNQLQLFNPPAAIDNIKHFLRRTVDVGLGTITGGAALLLFTQYGYDGFKILIQLSTGYSGFDDLPYPAKLSIGLLAAASSGVLGFLAGFDITNTIHTAYDYMKEKKINIIKVIVIGVGCGIAATSIAGAAIAIIEKPNLFNITEKSAASYYLIGGNLLFASSFDARAILELVIKNDPTYNNSIHWLEKHKLSDETISALRQHSYFKKKTNESDLLLAKEIVENEETSRYLTV